MRPAAACRWPIPANLTSCSGALESHTRTFTRPIFSRALASPIGFPRSSVIRGGAGRFLTRLGVSDSVFLGGNPPLQPMVSIANGNVDNPGGTSRTRFYAEHHDPGSGIPESRGLGVESGATSVRSGWIRRRGGLCGTSGFTRPARTQYQPAPAGNASGESWHQSRLPAAVQGIQDDSSDQQ